MSIAISSPRHVSILPRHGSHNILNSRSLFRRLKIASAMLFCGLFSSACLSQAKFTAEKPLSIQVGGTYSNVNSDYARSRFNGYGIYGDVDFWHHYGIEATYHYGTDGDPNTHIRMKTYEVGPRYYFHYRKFVPYAKAMYGRGVFNYPGPQFSSDASLAYNMLVLGGGTDYRLTKHINARADFEFQRWFSFYNPGPPARTDSLSPTMFSGGFAYHF